MNILSAHCKNLAFSEPVAKIGGGFIVAPGNPTGIQTYADISDKAATLVKGAGYSNIDAAKSAGVAEDKIMIVPGPTEVLAAVREARADAGSYTTMKQSADSSGGAVKIVDPSGMPEESFNWAGVGFREQDQDLLDQFNAAQKDYLGSPDRLTAMAEYGDSEAMLPGDKTTQWVCANR